MASHHMFNLRAVLVGVLSLATAGPAAGLELTISTNKTQYYPGEPMEIRVTALNPSPMDLRLDFPTSCQMYYQVGPYSTPELCLMVLTSVTVPGLGSHTWRMQHPWSRYSPGIGTHTVCGGLYLYGFAGAAQFEVIEPRLPTGRFLVDFDHVPGTDAPLGSLDGLWFCGLHFRSIAGGPPGLEESEGNRYVTVGHCTYPTGFNVVVDFDMPVFGITSRVDAGGGNGVTAIARARDGTELDRGVLTATPYPTLAGFMNLQSATPIASVEWWPSNSKATVRIDDLYVIPFACRADFDADGDVDVSDLAHLMACRTGPAVRQADPACLDARLDGDEDVDQSDFGLLQGCLAAHGRPPSVACGSW